MPTKTKELSLLYEQTAKQATNSLANWTGFLTTVGNLYKYPFHEQLMIYAQRPDATACAEYGLWNDKMNRYVHRGTKGIALMDTTSENPQIKYVFDVSDTGGRENSRRPFLWEMQSLITHAVKQGIKLSALRGFVCFLFGEKESVYRYIQKGDKLIKDL